MIILAATVCMIVEPPVVICRTEVFRTERTVEACAAMLAPVHAWLIEATVGLPVVMVGVACKGGLVV